MGDFDALGSLDDYIDKEDLEGEINDYEQSIARASFGDMVNDFERNRLFYEGIKKSVKQLREKNVKEVYALDIGCGTGLLSMMAVRAGADKVIGMFASNLVFIFPNFSCYSACDTFKPIAECAQKIIDKNGVGEKITIVPKQSNNLTLDEKDSKPNLLVAELLDTELIGEGCLFAYRDAIKRLVSDDALFVPSRARVYIQLVQSEQLFRFHHYRKQYTVEGSTVHLNTPNAVNNCLGSHILHDVQMSRLKPGKDFQILSDPLMVFDFEFNNLESLKLKNCKRLNIPLLKQFTEPILIFSWWDIDMDQEGEITLSCAPYWVQGKPSEESIAWRDHWIQTIYYLPAFAFVDNDLEGFKHEEINASKCIHIDAFHDSFSFWYDLPANQKVIAPLEINTDSWSCNCGLHTHLSRSRMLSINDEQVHSAYLKALTSQLEVHFREQSKLNLVYFGDESLIPLLLAAHKSVGQIYLHCQSKQSQSFFKKFLAKNEHIVSKVTLLKAADFGEFFDSKYDLKVHGIVSELYFKNFDCLFPSMEYFECLRSYYQLLLEHAHSSKLLSIPNRISIKCLLVEFREFWRSFADVGADVEGFDLTPYDQLIQSARKQADWPIEPQQVWEYSCKPLLQSPLDLFTFTADNFSQQQTLTKTVAIDLSHLEEKFSAPRWPEKVAIVVWTEHTLDDAGQITLSTGPQSSAPWSLQEEIPWSRQAHQGVAFLGKHWLPSAKDDDRQLKITFTRSVDGKSLNYAL